MTRCRRNFFSVLAIILILLTYTWKNLNSNKYNRPENVIAWDIRSYYAYLPATFIEKDYQLHFLSNLEVNNVWMYWYEQTPNGGLVFKTSMGIAIMYAPFFFVAHSFAEKLGFPADGFSVPYAFALIFSCVFYLGVGFVFLRLLLLKYYKDIIVVVTLLIIGLATNLFWYATYEAPMSHGYSFALFCFFLYLTEKWHERQGWNITIFMGLILGLISLIRPTNVIIVFIFLLFNITNLKDIGQRIRLFLKNYGKIIVMMICVLIVWFPQLLYWKTITGDWLYYSYGANERFFFNDPKILSVLFGFRKGWLLYTPVMVFAVIGIGMLWKVNKKFFYPILIFMIINIYILSSWWCWWYGGGFGLRALIDCYAILSIPLATFFTWITQRKLMIRIALWIIVGAITFQSVFHYFQYKFGAIHWDSMTKSAYIYSFWHAKAGDSFNSLILEPDYESARKGIR